jgi:hypothetical protein
MTNTFNQRNNLAASNPKKEQENIEKVRKLVNVLNIGNINNTKEIVHDKYYNNKS